MKPIRLSTHARGQMEIKNDNRAKGAETRRGRFAQNLAWWRTARNLTMKEAPQKLGVVPSTWSQWESGLRVPSVAYLGSLGTVLRLPQCCLLSANPAECMHCARVSELSSGPGEVPTA